MIKNLRNRSALVLIAAAVLSIAIWTITGSTKVVFEQDRWKNWIETEAELSLRWDMVGDLQKKHILIGMTKFEVVDLLGEPDADDPAEISYYLGMARKGINTGRLTLIFGTGDLVTSFDVFDG